MAYMIIMLEDAGPRQVIFHPDNWFTVPGLWRGNNMRPARPEDFVLDLNDTRRGLLVPRERMPKVLRLWGNRKSLPAMFEIHGGIFGVSQIGKTFLEREAPGDCEFIPVTIVPQKKSASPLDGQFYWLNIMRRLDSIEYDKTNIGFVEHAWVDESGNPGGGIDAHLPVEPLQIALRSKDIRGAQIWREQFKESNAGRFFFVSDDLFAKIAKTKIAKFVFAKASEM